MTTKHRSAKEIKDLTKFMQDLGVREFELDGIKASFWEPRYVWRSGSPASTGEPISLESLRPGPNEVFTDDDLGFTTPPSLSDPDDDQHNPNGGS